MIAQDGRLRPSLKLVLSCWSLIALAWAPAILMMEQRSFTAIDMLRVLLVSMLSFTPWVAATFLLLHLCRRFPIGTGRTVEAIMIFLFLGVVLLPTITLLGRLLVVPLEIMVFGESRPLDWGLLLRGVIVTSLFAIPTYVAVLAIGQTLVAAERHRAREKEMAGLQMKALKAELNPHFLFNTLGGIAQLAHESPDRAETAIGQLADVMRASLAERSETRPLAEEVAALSDHLELHRALVSDIGFDLAVDPDLWQANVPTLLLMPLVENAMTHGLSHVDGARWLRLSARRMDTARLELVLENPRNAHTPPSKGLGSGLDNVRQRIAMIGQDAAMHVDDCQPGLFAVRLVLPLTHA